VTGWQAPRPGRVQLSRSRGWRKPPGAVVVARPARWGNPHPAGRACPVPGCGAVVHDRAAAVEGYRVWLRSRPDLVAAVRRELAGRDLACWCPQAEPCHADVLLAVAAGGAP
jgi:hypothetical protein